MQVLAANILMRISILKIVCECFPPWKESRPYIWIFVAMDNTAKGGLTIFGTSYRNSSNISNFYNTRSNTSNFYNTVIYRHMGFNLNMGFL